MIYPAVLFDLDGTLVDSFADIAAAAAGAFGDVDLAADAAVLHLATRGAPLEDFYRAAVGADAGAAAEAARFAAFAAAYRRRYLAGCLDTTRPYPGVAALLGELHRRSRVAVATTKKTETATRVLEGTGLLPFVDVVCGCDDLPVKPDPAVLHRAAARLGVAAAAAAMVGDTDRDVLAAQRAGAAAIAVTWGGFSAEELLRLGPATVVSTTAELAAALQ